MKLTVYDKGRTVLETDKYCRVCVNSYKDELWCYWDADCEPDTYRITETMSFAVGTLARSDVRERELER